MMIKILCVAIVLIPTLIAALVLSLSHALFAVPEVLLGSAQPIIATLCVIAGLILLVPLLITIAVAISNWISQKCNVKKSGRF